MSGREEARNQTSEKKQTRSEQSEKGCSNTTTGLEQERAVDHHVLTESQSKPVGKGPEHFENNPKELTEDFVNMAGVYKCY